MPLTDQERRCVELAAAYLAERHQGEWSVPAAPTLADMDSSEPSPEVVIGNGILTGAIEVKELRDAVFSVYRHYLFSLNEYLRPTIAGRYRLDPADTVHLPLEKKLRKHLRERAAQGMRPGERRPVRVPQQALLKLVRPGPGPVFCAHYFDTIRRFSDRLPGSFFLVDEDCMDHKLFTQQGENDFAAALNGAAHAALRDGSATMRWYEEWELERVADNDQDGLWFVTVTAAHDVSGTITEAVEAMIAAGLRKFARKRWADIQVLVLDKSSVIMEAELVAAAISDLEETDMSALDAILLAEEKRVTPVWEHAR